jgi:peptidoglycan/xylan/chitin deacetylase (PgdA/CDA1 family)
VIPFCSTFDALRATPRRRSVAITFDDGYDDNYQYAAPLLAKHDLPATFFPTIGFIDRDPTIIEHFHTLQNADPRSVRPMQWRQLRELARAGFEIGSHTYSHRNLKMLGDRDAYREMLRSREVLEQNVGQAVRMMAYPFGNPGRHVISRTTEIAAEAGYELAAGIVYRAVRPSDRPLLIPRFTICGDSVARLRAKILGYWDLVGVCQQRLH